MAKMKNNLINHNIFKQIFDKKNKLKGSSNSFNRYLYNHSKDFGEYNSGESIIDTTGYISLTDLLSRCGVKGSEPNWPTTDIGSIDKFSNNFDVAMAGKQVENEARKIFEAKKAEAIEKAKKTISEKVKNESVQESEVK